MNDIDPREILDRSLRFWWVAAVGVFLGGAAAWLFTSFRPPVYEATATYSVTLDTQQLAGRLKLDPSQVPTDFASQNPYLAPAENVFYLPGVISRMASDAQAQGIDFTAGDFRPSAFYLDRKGSNWFVSARSTDPALAARLADLWLAAADAALRTAQAHNARAMDLQEQLDRMQACFAGKDLPAANLCAGTSFATPADLEAARSSLQAQAQSERDAGWGIDPALEFTLVRPASAPSYPVLYTRSLVILAGALIGLLAGALVVQRLPARERRA